MTFYSPVAGDYYISSPFGTRDSPGGIGSTNHMGLDLAASYGTPVVAPTDITITKAGLNGGFGNYVSGVDAAGNTYEFGHLSAIDVSRGDTLAAGSVLGAVGSTGNSTGNHLHFGVKNALGKYVDPKSLLGSATKLATDKAKAAAQKFLSKQVASAVASSIPGGTVALEAAGALGIGPGASDCGIICQIKNWFKESGFFARLALSVVAIVFLMAAFSLLARGQATKVFSQAIKS